MGNLYLVATPIGNLEDVTLRALRVLGECALVLAEDTRRTRVLLEHHDVKAELRSLHAHNEAARIDEVMERLAAGDVALVADAGTPLVSDPGHRIAAAAADSGHEVIPIPGPSAVLAALMASGLPEAPFSFLGFLPRRAGPRRRLLESYRGRPETVVLFESPRRLAATLRELAEMFGARRACVARELTKLHEEVVRAPLPELAERFAEGARGELTLVIAGADPEENLQEITPEVDEAIRELLAQGRGAKEIAAEVSTQTGLSKRELYARVLALRESS